jgi:hypothetical protein
MRFVEPRGFSGKVKRTVRPGRSCTPLKCLGDYFRSPKLSRGKIPHHRETRRSAVVPKSTAPAHWLGASIRRLQLRVIALPDTIYTG